jgi:hypothetical protein
LQNTPDTPESPAADALDTIDTPTRASQKRFLEEYATLGNVSTAATAANIHRATHYLWLKDKDYEARFKDAESQYCDLIRETVRNRAIVGTPHEIYYQGTFVGLKHEFSDRLLELEAKAHCPEYKDKHEITGAGGGPLKIEVVTGVPQPDSEDSD